MLVVIPTAGIGSRLDLHTKYFNKSMIQLGDGPVISKVLTRTPLNQNLSLLLVTKEIARIFEFKLPQKKN